MKSIEYGELVEHPGFFKLIGVLAAIALLGLGAAYYMEHNGHWVTGMSNQIVWGMPHVFALFLIVAASGALNVASIASVFGKTDYKPLSRLSAVLAIALLAGGLMVLVLDLGRPERLLVAMTTYNFKSIFAWNIFLYNGFFAIVLIYLWVMMEKRMQYLSSGVGLFAFVWRLILTTGTGSIFGFLAAREAYDAAIMAPMFVIMSFSFGLAVFLVVLMAAYHSSGRLLGEDVIDRLRRLLGVFAAAVIYFALIYHLTSLYATEHHGVERFLLLDGGIYPLLFWLVQIGVGGLLPLFLCTYRGFANNTGPALTAALLIVAGGFAQLYVIIIGGQAYPMVLFPGMEVSSSFYDGAVAEYAPTLAETLLGIGGVAVALLITAMAVRFLPILPMRLGTATMVTEPEVESEDEAEPAASAA
jgi:molybdopterin-containing oxidoreductase family membrane subunit